MNRRTRISAAGGFGRPSALAEAGGQQIRSEREDRLRGGRRLLREKRRNRGVGMTNGFTKLAGQLVGVTVLAVGGGALSAGPAQADASGCTLAQGYSAARNCISVEGKRLNVDRVTSAYAAGVAPWPNQLCDREHELIFTAKDANEPQFRSMTIIDCMPGLPGQSGDGLAIRSFQNDYVDWNDLGELKDGSSICTRSKNSHTGYQWTPWACKTIKQDGWWWGS